MIWEESDPKLETRAGQGAGSRTYPAKQCAAVSTQDVSTRTPPHRGCPLSCSLTSQGQAPGGAALPPIMRPWACVTLTVLGSLSPQGPRKAMRCHEGQVLAVRTIEAFPGSTCSQSCPLETFQPHLAHLGPGGRGLEA